MPNRSDKNNRPSNVDEAARARSESRNRPRATPDPAPDRRSMPAGRVYPRNRRLEERTVAELRERAKQLDIGGRSKMNKEELVRAIRRKNG